MGALIAAAVAAAFAGALVGLGEALFVTINSSAAKESWLFLFGASSYLGHHLGLKTHGNHLRQLGVSASSSAPRHLIPFSGRVCF